jgi:hypothetical protein
MSTIHFAIQHDDGCYTFFDNEIDMYEYAMKHNYDINSTECMVYDADYNGVKEITRDALIEGGGIDHTEEGETLLDYINRRPDAETDYLDMIIKLRKEIDDLKTQLIKVPKKSMNYGYMKNLEKENKQLIKKFDSIQEYIDLDKNENGLITNYELRAIDFRLNPEDYEPGI